MSGPNHVLPPASTSKIDLRSQAAGFFAQRRKGGNVHEAAPRASQAVQDVYAASELSEVTEARQVAQEPLRPTDQSTQRYTLAQLVQRIQEGRRRQQQVVDAGDPDGPDETSWNPGDLNPRGAKLAASLIAQQRRRT